MTRHRKPPDPPSKAELEGALWLHGGPLPGVRSRAKPVQHEAQAMQAVLEGVSHMWWRHGFRRIEHASSSSADRLRRHAQGVRAGDWPDIIVHVPTYEDVAPKLLAVELKAEKERTQRNTGKWWIRWARELEQTREQWETKKHETESGGLRASQAIGLLALHRVGYRTHVAYGAVDALEWMSNEIGPRPARLPEGW